MSATDLVTLVAALSGLMTGMAALWKTYSDKESAAASSLVQQKELEDRVRASLWEQVQGTIDKQAREIQELTKQIEGMWSRLTEVITERDQLKAKVIALSIQVEELRGLVRETTEERDLLKGRVTELEKEVVLLQQENKKLKQGNS